MTREEAIKKLESLKISLPAAKSEISEIIKLIETPWINVKDDLPCNHEELWVMTGGLIYTIYTEKVLVILTDSTVRLLSMLYDEVNDKWKWEFKDNIIFWMPIPELPKE